MNVYTYVESVWDGKKYVPFYAEYYKYNGLVALVCGATGQQKQLGQEQTSTYGTLVQQAGQVFGMSDKVFNDLFTTFAPLVAAGPNQDGFDAQTMAALNSQAVTQSGIQANNAMTAVKEANAAVGGGNIALPSGAAVGRDLSIANSASQNTANQLTNIQLQNKNLGRQNFWAAQSALAGAPSVYNPATQAVGVTTGAGEAAANTENQIAQEGNAWMGMVGGVLGGIAGDVATGGMSNLGAGVGFFGQNAPAPTPS